MAYSLRLPIDDFEKTLLRDYLVTFGDAALEFRASRTTLHMGSFARWRWRSLVYGQLHRTCYSDELFHFHNGDQARLWALFLNRLQWVLSHSDSHFSKVLGLQTSNPEFPQSFQDPERGLPSLVPADEDAESWLLISDMFFAFHCNTSIFSDGDALDVRYERHFRVEEQVPPIMAGSDHHQPLMDLSSPSTTQQMDAGEIEAAPSVGEQSSSLVGKEELKVDPLDDGDGDGNDPDSNINEEQTFKQNKKADEFEIWSLVRQCAMIERGGRQRDKIWSALLQCGFAELYDQVGNGYLRKDLREKRNKDGGYWYTFGLPDPSTFIEYVPWSDLIISAPEKLPPWLEEPHEFASWHPARASKYDHLLRTDEETYRFSIDLNLTWPYHKEGGHVIFALLSLKGSAFVQELHYFWSEWNDCAITQNPETQEWILLQTIPGLDYHRIAREKGPVEPVKHFCRIMDGLRFGRPQKLQDVLGLDYPLRYEDLVDVIPYEQLLSVDPTPLGEGERGIVYKARWARPQMSDMPGSAEVDVALKVLKTSDPDHLKHFFRELDADLTLLRGWSIAGMRFFGVMRTPPRLAHNRDPVAARHPDDVLPPDVLLLVQEYASKGNLLGYLDATLMGSPDDWRIVLELMSNLCSNLCYLHNADIIHRDLHENNVLLGIRETPNDPQVSYVVELKISDLGESTLAASPTTGLTYYGDQQSWAPEVRSYRIYSKASDVYSVGCIFAKMVKRVWDRAAATTGERSYLAPKQILDLIKRCTQPDPGKRPEIDELTGSIEDIEFENVNNLDSLLSQMVQVDIDSLLEEELEEAAADPEIPE